MREQVRMFTPDKVKYADQLFGAAEVPHPPAVFFTSSSQNPHTRTYLSTHPGASGASAAAAKPIPGLR